MKYIIAVLGLAAGTAAQADGVRFNDIPTGEALRFQASNGQILEHVFRGRNWGRYVVDTFALEDGARNRLFEARFDAEGRLVEVRDTAGGKIRYKPHRCTGVEGTCRYEVILPGGARETRVQELQQDGPRQTITTRDGSGRVLSSAERDVDARGWTLNSTVTAAGQTLRLTRIGGG